MNKYYQNELDNLRDLAREFAAEKGVADRLTAIEGSLSIMIFHLIRILMINPK